MHKLIGLYYSPWTERARWAMDFHNIPYQYAEYTTLLDEPWLRFHAKKAVGKVSVPLLITPQQNVNDSLLIARFADANSSKNPLIPAERLDAIRQWTESAEKALYAARIRATRRMSKSPASLAERLPAFIPDFLRKPLVPMSYVGARFILRKYKVDMASEEQLLGHMDDFLAKAEKALKNREFISDTFSFADIIIATMLQAVTPVDPKYIDLGEASSKIMREPILEEKYASLITWRDGIYARYR